MAASFLSLATLWGAGINLTPAIVFTTSLTFTTLADSVVQAVVEGIYTFSLLNVTISRLESFLTSGDPQGTLEEGWLGNATFSGRTPDKADELRKNERPQPMTNLDLPGNTFKGSGIEMRNVSSYVKKKNDSNMFRLLHEVSLQCNGRDLIAITGATGSGKSSVLEAIVGEIPVTNGQISVAGKISYMPQNPWLFSGTVKENILFGNEFDEQKYQATIEACSLTDDFEQLPHGDMTQVGESGVALSGGQRARVSLARTAYSDADIFLLDSPLKAVDAKVGKLSYQNCICGLLSTRPRIHVTNYKNYLRNASVVLRMENGCIVSRAEPVCNEEDEKGDQTDVKETLEMDFEPHAKVSNGNTNRKVPPLGEEGISTVDEDRETGTVSTRTYIRYLTAGASLLGVLLRILFNIIPGGKFVKLLNCSILF